MKKKVIYLLLLLTFTFPEFSNAQKMRGGAGFLKLGYANSPGSAILFNKIAPDRIEGFKNNFFVIGWEGYYRTGKMILGLEGYTGGQDTRSVDNLYVDAYSAASYVKFGWILRESTDYWIYPSVGFGSSFIGTYDYLIKYGQLQEYHKQVVVSPSVNIGINADFISTKYPFNNNRYNGGLILGIRTGYHFSNGENSWRNYRAYKSESLPLYTNNGFYFMLTIGGGVFAK